MTEDIKGFILSIIGIGLVLTVGLIVMGQLKNSVSQPTCIPVVDGAATEFNGTETCQAWACQNNSLVIAPPGASGSGLYHVNSTRANCYNSTDNGLVSTVLAPAIVPASYNTTKSIENNLSTIPNWIGILITVSLAFIVLGYFYNR